MKQNMHKCNMRAHTHIYSHFKLQASAQHVILNVLKSLYKLNWRLLKCHDELSRQPSFSVKG